MNEQRIIGEEWAGQFAMQRLYVSALIEVASRREYDPAFCDHIEALLAHIEAQEPKPVVVREQAAILEEIRQEQVRGIPSQCVCGAVGGSRHDHFRQAAR